MIVPSSVESVALNVQASWLHAAVKLATGFWLVGVPAGGSTIVQPMPLLPAVVEVAVAPGQVPVPLMLSPIAAVMRPPPVPIEVVRVVTEAGTVQPVLPDVLSAQ